MIQRVAIAAAGELAITPLATALRSVVDQPAAMAVLGLPVAIGAAVAGIGALVSVEAPRARAKPSAPA